MSTAPSRFLRAKPPDNLITLEIAPNPNCEAVELRVFHDLDPSRPVGYVRVERSGGAPQWYRVTGWTQEGTPTPAQARKVDDSGEGIVWLVSGGDAGLRLQPDGPQSAWRLKDLQQWGVPFLLMGDPADLRFLDDKSA